MWPDPAARTIGVMQGSSGTPAPGAAGFEDTVKDFWATRPRRPRRGRKIAGVAAGVAARYGIDPVLVRVVFVVATVVGGFGIPLYLLGWLFLPEEHDEVSPAEALVGKGRSSTSTAVTVLLVLVLVPIAGGTLSGLWFSGGGLIGVGLVGAGLYLLHRNRGQQYRPPTQAEAPAAVPSYPVAGDEDSARAAGPDAPGAPAPQSAPLDADPTVRSTPPAWDPLAAAPFAWDLPDPAPPSPPAPRPPRGRSAVGPATVGVALLVAGAGSALTALDVPWFTAAHTTGLVLAVLGAGLVVGAFTGGGRGLVLLAVPVAMAGLVLASAGSFFDRFDGDFGERSSTPRTAAEVRERYDVSAGRLELDLSALPPSPIPISTKVEVTMGEAVITVPRDATVSYTCEATMGEANCLGERTSGMAGGPITDTVEGTASGNRITLDVSTTMGSVEVRRG